jgi:transporter family-2 protein
MQAIGYIFLDFLAGMVIAIMVVCNTELGVSLTMGTSLVINHIVGLAIISTIMLLGKGSRTMHPERKKAPWYLWFGGLFGIAILNCNYYTIVNTGASLAMASTVFGQSAVSLLFDLTGILGMRRYGVNRKKLVSLAISLAGIIVMGGGSDGDGAFAFVLLGFLAGALTMVQMVLNSTFSRYKGSFFSARHNFVVGLAGGLLFYFLFFPQETAAGFANIGTVPFSLVIAGGSMAVFVVVATNIAVTRIPAIYSALILSASQILMSLAIDAAFYDKFSANLFAGALLMLAGMAGNLYADKEKATVNPA